MKRILLSISLPLFIVAVAWQFAPAETEAPDATSVENTAVTVAIADDNEIALATAPFAKRADGKVDYKRLLEQNPDLVGTLIDSMGEGGDGEYGEMIQLALISMDGAAVPDLLRILNDTEDEEKKVLIASLLGTASVFPSFPLESVVPALLKLAKSDDQETREIGVAMLAQVLHYQAMTEELRAALRLEILTGNL